MILLSIVLWLFLFYIDKGSVAPYYIRGGGGGSVSTETTYKYTVYFAHQNIDPNQSILIYNANGVLNYTISPNDPNMDYGRGIYVSPGSTANYVVEGLSTATYWVNYSTSAVTIDYDNVQFGISNTILPDPTNVTIASTFEYYTVYTPVINSSAIVDGRWDTQVQTEFFAEPPTGYKYAVIDLGQSRQIQAVDVIGGYYKPDAIRKFDVDFNFTLQYSLDGATFYEIGDKTHNVELSSGSSVSFTESDLGIGFACRYVQIILESVKKVDYGQVTAAIANLPAGIDYQTLATDTTQAILRTGVFVVAISEVSAYTDLIINSEAKLIPYCVLTAPVGPGDTSIQVDGTTSFTDPGSGATATAYIGNDVTKPFTYTYLTATSFEGCTVGSGITGGVGDSVTQSIAGDTDVYDTEKLLPKLGDKLFKDDRSQNQDVIYTQAQLDILAQAYLKEYYKDHSKLTAELMFAPYLKVGTTVDLSDAYNYISNQLYFVESVTNKAGAYSLVLARYPG